MKAVVYTKYGSPEVLRIEAVETPTPEKDEVLVRVHAASLNYGDTVLISGKPFVARLMGYGVRKPKYKTPGTDIAGRVEVVGENVDLFQPGDQVFGDLGRCGFGGFAEYVAVPARALTLKPVNMAYAQAAAAPQAAVVALQGLRDCGEIQAGQRVLVNGASGGIGSFAVQIAKAFGAEVTGVCSSQNVDLVYSLGADRVIDYGKDDFKKDRQNRYDLIFDIVANRPISDYMGALGPQGNYVACAFNPAALFLGPLISKNGKQALSLSHQPNREDLVMMKELMETGKVIPVIDRCFPLIEIQAAFRYIASGRGFGKVVVTMGPDDV